MDLTEIRDIAASCSNSGNALSWAQLSTGIEGAVEVISRSERCGSKLCPISFVCSIQHYKK